MAARPWLIGRGLWVEPSTGPPSLATADTLATEATDADKELQLRPGLGEIDARSTFMSSEDKGRVNQ